VSRPALLGGEGVVRTRPAGRHNLFTLNRPWKWRIVLLQEAGWGAVGEGVVLVGGGFRTLELVNNTATFFPDT